MAFYRGTPGGRYVPIDPDAEGVIHCAVLPGFRFRIGDLFEMPSLETLANDPLYQPFVLVKYQAEMQRAAQAEEEARQAKEQARQAKVQAQQERQHAERLAARLRSLGIDEE